MPPTITSTPQQIRNSRTDKHEMFYSLERIVMSHTLKFELWYISCNQHRWFHFHLSMTSFRVSHQAFVNTVTLSIHIAPSQQKFISQSSRNSHRCPACIPFKQQYNHRTSCLGLPTFSNFSTGMTWGLLYPPGMSHSPGFRQYHDAPYKRAIPSRLLQIRHWCLALQDSTP